jgi:hypothetical protein
LRQEKNKSGVPKGFLLFVQNHPEIHATILTYLQLSCKGGAGEGEDALLSGCRKGNKKPGTEEELEKMTPGTARKKIDRDCALTYNDSREKSSLPSKVDRAPYSGLL